MIPDADPLLVLAVVTVVGLASAAVARRARAAGVTGQILAGVLIGRSGLELFDEHAVAAMRPITEFALAITALAVGGHLHFRRLRNARLRLGLILLAEVTVTPLVVYLGAVTVGGAEWSTALLLAALAISTAPATIVALVAESRSKGVFVKTLVGAVALNNIACIVFFEVARLAAQLNAAGGSLTLTLALRPLVQLALAPAVGVVLGAALVLVTMRVFSSERLATASVVAVLLASGLASNFDFSPLLTSLFLGVTLANLTPHKDEIVESAYVNVRQAIFAVFFTLAGMHLDFGLVIGGGALAMIVVLARAAGKIVGVGVALKVAGATDRLRANLGMALVPQAGIAVGLLLIAAEDPTLAAISPLLLAVGLTSVAANEVVGPLLARLALKRSGEAGLDRARLIDFLHEENIVTNLAASTKERAIEQLVDVLIRTNHLDDNRDDVLRSILTREAETSTCFGEGLAIPHGQLQHGDRIVGAMGISDDGLAFETPDGIPVHCMVVLATPKGARDRHLEVLATLARSVGKDRNLRSQLFHARSPAHAYELLHVEEDAGFDDFLDDE